MEIESNKNIKSENAIYRKIFEQSIFNIISCKNPIQQIMVSSHERSGTHFLINTIAENSIFSNNPVVNFDNHPISILLNFFHPGDIAQFFVTMHNEHCASIIKNHFSGEFFLSDDGVFCLPDYVRVIYIVRNPIDTLASFHRFVEVCAWREGPKGKTLLEFMMSPPEGHLMRYQSRQYRTMLDRWQHHVLSWLQIAQRAPNVMIVHYDDLKHDHSKTTRQVLEFAEIKAPEIILKPEGLNSTIHVPGGRKLFPEERAHLLDVVRSELVSDELLAFVK